MGWRSAVAAKAQGEDEDDDPNGVESLMMILKPIASMIYQGYLPEEHKLTTFGSMHTQPGVVAFLYQ
ncbi:hypothetical protein D8674_038574 [Pyrus ussuriensis x Pyrus communis]|uniref:Uncharacterized protein n=1 Tax=Pyrus ussuriensis x Pyrus communis TaxID=2448454 RepID=A0A5N5GL45_9ROSA|nr:hypothetical protein D8674_038547 [Pyrus ussuriensis x Pyrus communis]KAB2634168.1 hypothetical protein D8674_038574 [Pyrus ussuriensis x Pyrus communis]